MKKVLYFLLKITARSVLWKYRPLVVAVTGSVGKSSTKEAIAAVLESKFRCRKTSGNYNNQLGLPLTIIGSRSGGRNPFLWLWIFLKGFMLFVLPVRYPQVLVLEMGADRVGDINYLTSIARPHFGVVTSVGQSHLEYFGRVEKIAMEKSRLVSALGKSGKAILNYDDGLVQAMAATHKGETVFYGTDPDADVCALEVAYKESGIFFKVRYLGNIVPIHLPGSVGMPSVYASLAAIAVGLSVDMNLVDIGQGLMNFRTLPGRLRLLPGVKSSLIVDDTYNAAPVSCLAALEVLARMPGRHKIAVFGDMAELGEYTELGHREVGTAVAKHKVDFLVVVGERSKFIAEEAVKKGLSDSHIWEFDTADEARKSVEKLIGRGDAVLVKGSRMMQMEKIVKEIMAEPEREELLVHN